MNIENLLIVATAVSGVTFTISVTSVFSWLRELMTRIHPKLEELIFCPFCLSFYFSAFIVWYDGIKHPVAFLTYVFSIMAISGCVHFVLLRAYKPVAEAFSDRLFKRQRADKAARQHLADTSRH